MNKPIVAHSFEEMNKLDTELVNDIPLPKRKAAWKAITELFVEPTSAASQNQPSKVRRKTPGWFSNLLGNIKLDSVDDDPR